MRTIFRVGAIVALVGIIAGCSMPRSPIVGSIYMQVKANDVANPGDLPAPDKMKVGEATAQSVVGVTTGDCSIDAAVKNGQLKKIYYVDYETFCILSVYAKTTTKVYGE